MKSLLLVPPGDRLYLRDYYCSKTSKGNYLYHPVDLLYLSGFLKVQGDNVFFLDAQADRLDFLQTIARVRNIAPERVYSFSGLASLDNDSKFFKQFFNALPGTSLFLSGDYFFSRNALSAGRDFPGLTAVTADFSAFEFSSPGELPLRKRCSFEPYAVPLPMHELVSHPCYYYPFLTTGSFATVLTDYGCPHGCSFCLIGSLGYKQRLISNVLTELSHLRALGKSAIYFSDQNFTAVPERTIQLCREMKKRNLVFESAVFARLDQVSPQVLSAMYDSGVRTAIFGLESYHLGTRNSNKHLALGMDELKQRLELVSRFGIRPAATFILGLTPGENFKRWASFLHKLPLDFVSFNILVDRKTGDAGAGADQSSYSPLFSKERNRELLSLRRKLYFYFYFGLGKVWNFRHYSIPQLGKLSGNLRILARKS